jgi:hypothetical protein
MGKTVYSMGFYTVFWGVASVSLLLNRPPASNPPQIVFKTIATL